SEWSLTYFRNSSASFMLALFSLVTARTADTAKKSRTAPGRPSMSPANSQGLPRPDVAFGNSRLNREFVSGIHGPILAGRTPVGKGLAWQVYLDFSGFTGRQCHLAETFEFAPWPRH